MIELREDQLQQLDGEQQPPVAIDPRTGQEYLLIKREVYNLVSGILRPYNRDWDPDEGLIRKDTRAIADPSDRGRAVQRGDAANR